MKPLEKVLETCLYVDDLEAAERFYGEVLGLEFDSRQEGRHVFFRCGRQMVLLFEPTASASPTSVLPLHGSHGPGHLAFGVPETDIDSWIEYLTERKIAIEKIFEWPNGGRSIYFRDPSGNSLEVTSPSIWGLPD